MIRETSIEAYRHLVENGILAEKNRVVYEYLWKNGATTQKKTERNFNDRTYTLRPRFAQLEKMGLIKVVGEINCEETGRKNLLWDVTDRVYPLPIKRKKDYTTELINKLKSFESKVDIFYKQEVREILGIARQISL